jgi:Bacterial regulatory protein, arsR family
MSVLARPDQAVPLQVGDGGQQLVVAPVPAAQTQFLLESTETRLEKCGDFVDGHTGAVPTRCAIAGRRVNITDLLERAREASDFFKALAHESRLVILCLLGGGEKSVMEIADLLGQRQPFVSQRLARPKGDDMVKARRDGKHI